MPIEGKFYESEELQLLLGVTKQRITNLFGECAIKPGLYPAEVVEPHLQNHNIEPHRLPVRTHDHPDGATWAELEKEFGEMQEIFSEGVIPLTGPFDSRTDARKYEDGIDPDDFFPEVPNPKLVKGFDEKFYFADTRIADGPIIQEIDGVVIDR